MNLETQTPEVPERTKWVAVVVAFALIPLLIIINAWIYAHVWDLTLSAQFGSGPTEQSWIGISALTALLTRHVKCEDPDDKRSPLQRIVSKLVTHFLYVGLLLLSLYVVGKMRGWS